MTTHICSVCGKMTECDKRNMGTGRKHPAGWKPGDNHATVYKALASLGDASSVEQIRQFLNNQLNSNHLEWQRVKGHGIFWGQIAVETCVSDLVGIGVLNSFPNMAGRGFVYAVRTAYPT